MNGKTFWQILDGCGLIKAVYDNPTFKKTPNSK